MAALHFSKLKIDKALQFIISGQDLSRTFTMSDV